jgi:hypothetical protein
LVKAAAEQFSVSHITLQRHMEKHIKSGNEKFADTNKCAVWTVFSGEEECKIIDYITTASNIPFGLSRKEVMESA